MGLLQFFGALFFFVWFTSSIFWGIAGAAVASWTRIDFKIAIPVGAVFQGLGVLGLWVYSLIRRQTPAGQFYARPNDPFGASAGDPFAASSSASPFGSAATSNAFGENPFGGNAFTLASRNQGWISSLPGRAVVFGSIALIGTFIWSLFLTWFNITMPDRSSGAINAFSTGFEFWVFISIGIMIAAVILCLKKPSLISSVLLALVGSWWLMLSTASLTARDTFVAAVDHLFNIPNLITAADGYSATWAYDVGTAWYLIFFNALLLLVASIWMLIVAHREVSKS
jgi:hypothetical protein